MTPEEAVRAFLINELHWDGDERLLTIDFPLIESHVVDSLGLFTLVSFVEQHFGVVVDDEELLPENFGTIGKITQLIDRKRSGVGGPV